MLNAPLFNAIRMAFGQEPNIANEGMEAVFSCPKAKHSRLLRKQRKYATIHHWGECYNIDCPLCKDTKHRLWFCHLYGMTTQIKETDGGTYYFGRAYVCYNEHCDLRARLNEMKYDENVMLTKTKPSAFIGIMQTETELPKGCIPLLAANVPTSVIDYVCQRGFAPEELANTYWIHYAPKGTCWNDDNKKDKRIFYDDRLIVPVIQGRRLVGYQARIVGPAGKDVPKYLTVGVKTASSLYNRDVAMYHRDIVMVEGVTDVWRIGPQAVALFGKTLKGGQQELAKLLWGFSGSCVVCLDRDDPKAVEDQRRLIQLLRYAKVFPRGVASAELPPGKDPADVPRQELLGIIEQARATCR